MHRTKYVTPETKVLDAKAGRVHAVVSTETRDRDGDIIRVAGWNLENFMKHPVMLSGHDYVKLRSTIGEWEDMTVKAKRLEGVAKYYVGAGNEEADWAFYLASQGKAAYSVGFVPDMALAKELESGNGWLPSYEFNGQELLEVSQVSIPSNPQALQTLKGLCEAGWIAPCLRDIVDMQADVRTPGDVSLDTESSSNMTDADTTSYIWVSNGGLVPLKSLPGLEALENFVRDLVADEVMKHSNIVPTVPDAIESGTVVTVLEKLHPILEAIKRW